MVNQQVLPQMRLLCFPCEEECRIYFACYTSYGNSWEVDDASLHLEQNDGEADSGQFLLKRHHFVASGTNLCRTDANDTVAANT